MCAVLLQMQFTSGPGGHAITVTRLESLAWDVVDNIITTDPVVAKKLPQPPGLPLTLQPTEPAPLVQTVNNCNRLQVLGTAA